MPPAAPPSYQSLPPRHHRARNVALILGAIAAVIVLILMYETGVLPFGAPAAQIEFVGTSSAAIYTVRGNALSLASSSVQEIGPFSSKDGYTVFSILALPTPAPTKPGTPLPVVVTLPTPVWNLSAGSEASPTALGLGRPLGTDENGTLFVLTSSGVTAYVPGAKHSVITLPSSDLVGALSDDTIALGNPVTQATDIYTIDPHSLASTYLASIPGNPAAVAFDAAGRLFIVMQDRSIVIYGAPLAGQALEPITTIASTTMSL